MNCVSLMSHYCGNSAFTSIGRTLEKDSVHRIRANKALNMLINLPQHLHAIHQLKWYRSAECLNRIQQCTLCWGTISASGFCPWGTESTSRYCPVGQNLNIFDACRGLLLRGTAHLLHIARSFSVLKRTTFDRQSAKCD